MYWPVNRIPKQTPRLQQSNAYADVWHACGWLEAELFAPHANHNSGARLWAVPFSVLGKTHASAEYEHPRSATFAWPCEYNRFVKLKSV